MNRLIAILLLTLATAVQAGEVIIVETESAIIAEYTGSPSSTGNDSEIPALAVKNDNAAMVNLLTAQIEKLKTEVSEILKLTGNETEDEKQALEALAAEKKRQIEFYEDEIRQMPGKQQSETVEKDAPRPGTQREMIKRYKDLRKSRKASSTSSATE